METVDRAALYQDALTARQAAIRYVRENTKPEDKVLAWRDTRVNYFAQRESPTRYLVMRPLMDADARARRARWNSWMNFWRKSPR